MYTTIFLLILSGLTLQEGNGHTYSLGECPVVEPMPGFEMNKLLGLWYVIQKTSTASTCLTYNFTRSEEPGEYDLEQISQHFILGLTPLEHQYHYKGHLSVPEPSTPGRMTVKFPLNVAGSASYTVFMTDYENYAGIFTCQKLAFARRQSATILSRTKTLDKMYVDKIRTRLSSYNIDPFELSIISQRDCPKNSTGYNINIDDDTFTAHSVAGAVRTVGEKAGDGIEYVAGKAKQVYSEATHKHSPSENTNKKDNIVHPDAEWLP